MDENEKAPLPARVDEVDRLTVKTLLLEGKLLEAQGREFQQKMGALMSAMFAKYAVPTNGSIDAESGEIKR